MCIRDSSWSCSHRDLVVISRMRCCCSQRDLITVSCTRHFYANTRLVTPRMQYLCPRRNLVAVSCMRHCYANKYVVITWARWLLLGCYIAHATPCSHRYLAANEYEVLGNRNTQATPRVLYHACDTAALIETWLVINTWQPGHADLLWKC